MDRTATYAFKDHTREDCAMIRRREFILTSAAASTVVLLPGAALARPALANFDIVEVGMIRGVPGVSGTLRIANGAFLTPDQARRPVGNRLLALLSPANAALLGEYVRFDQGVKLDDQPFPALGLPESLAIRPDARLVSVHWTV